MGIVSVAPVGAIGIVKDIKPAELPPGAWSDGRNVQFQQGAVNSAPDSVVLLQDTPIALNSAIPSAITTNGFASWVVGGATKLYAFVVGTLTDISRVSGGAYTGAAGKRWSGGVLSGITVVHNGTDVPQAWMTPDPAVPVIPLANWPTGLTANCLRSFKQFLVALDVTKSGTRYPTLVKWSHPADPGTVPVSWNEADATKDAGEYPLSETPGYCVDCLSLRDINVIYKQDSVWGMQYIGGEYVFKFYKMFGDFGVPQRDCVIEHVSGKHCVFTGTDLIVHDGQTVQSVLGGRLRSMLKTLSAAQLTSAFLSANMNAKEVWLSFRMATDSTVAADTAIVYNWESNTSSIRSLPNYTFIANGRLDPPTIGVATWATATGTWSSHTEEWGEVQAIPSQMRMFGLKADSILWVDAVGTSAQNCWVERQHLGFPAKANVAPDLSSEKLVTRMWPRITGKTGDVVNITLGVSENPAKPTVWEPTQQFVIGVDEWVDCTLTGKMFGMRFESIGTSQWTFSGMDADVVLTGAG